MWVFEKRKCIDCPKLSFSNCVLFSTGHHNLSYILDADFGRWNIIPTPILTVFHISVWEIVIKRWAQIDERDQNDTSLNNNFTVRTSVIMFPSYSIGVCQRRVCTRFHPWASCPCCRRLQVRWTFVAMFATSCSGVFIGVTVIICYFTSIRGDGSLSVHGECPGRDPADRPRPLLRPNRSPSASSRRR